jgi:hypothetical protein
MSESEASEFRMRWRKNWLEAISEFADRSLQERSWFGGPGFESPYYSFVEFNCRYFDDYALDQGYDSFVSDGLVSAIEANAVRNFHEVLSQYKSPRGDDYNHRAILDDPSWIEVIRLAEEAKSALLRVLRDPEELKTLRGDVA